jgi:hypothetical protein
VVVVLAVIAIRISGSRRSLHPAAQALPVAQPVSTSPAVAPRNVVISPTPGVAAQEPKTVAKPDQPNAQDLRGAVKAKRKASNSAHDQAADEGDTGADGAKKDGAHRTGITFSPDEINRLIALADRESGDGKFDGAISTYKIVLKHDPSNARAKEGLARAIRNRDHQ